MEYAIIIDHYSFVSEAERDNITAANLVSVGNVLITDRPPTDANSASSTTIYIYKDMPSRLLCRYEIINSGLTRGARKMKKVLYG